jgi:putative FmdB family regulatory protein
VPLYEYTCKSCGEDFDGFRHHGEAPPPCPNCGAADVRRRYSTFARLRIGLRGAAARDSNLRRTEREAARKERFAEQRKKRREGG